MQVLGWAGHTWSLEPGPALLRPRYGHCGATLAGQVVVVGGRGKEGVVDTVEVGTGGRGYNGQGVGVGIQSTGYRRVHGAVQVLDPVTRTVRAEQGWTTPSRRWPSSQYLHNIYKLSTSYLHTVYIISTGGPPPVCRARARGSCW